MQYKHILNVMVPPERLVYPYGVIEYQQDQKSIHDSCRNQAWPQADVVVTVWPPRQPDMNLIHSVRRLENKTMQEPGRLWLRQE